MIMSSTRGNAGMMRVTCLTLLAFVACSSGSSQAPTAAPPTAEPIVPPAAPTTIVWRDEFEGAAGASFDRSKWAADTGGGGFGNQERQFYTTRKENVALDGQGNLVITALKEPATSTYRCWYGPCLFTSTRLLTKGVFSQKYGRFESRLKVPRGQGLWPAFWMLGDNIDAVGWPRSGEIDIMEHIGREPGTAYGTLHGPGYSGAGGISRGETLLFGGYADDFHIFAVEWDAFEIRWYIDGKIYHRLKPQDLPSGAAWVFDQPFFLILNLAVGGAWPGDPNATTIFPQTLVVDYVRAYK